MLLFKALCLRLEHRLSCWWIFRFQPSKMLKPVLRVQFYLTPNWTNVLIQIYLLAWGCSLTALLLELLLATKRKVIPLPLHLLIGSYPLPPSFHICHFCGCTTSPSDQGPGGKQGQWWGRTPEGGGPCLLAAVWRYIGWALSKLTPVCTVAMRALVLTQLRESVGKSK